MIWPQFIRLAFKFLASKACLNIVTYPLEHVAHIEILTDSQICTHYALMITKQIIMISRNDFLCHGIWNNQLEGHLRIVLFMQKESE